MLQEIKSPSLPGLVKFESVRSLRTYLRNLMTQYEMEGDKYGNKVGRLMRILEIDGRGTGDLKRLREVEWRRSGMVLLNTKDPKRGTLELMIEVMEDYKAKAKRTAEVLASINDLDELNVPAGGFILVYLRHGVPLRILVDGGKTPEVEGIITPTTA